MPLPRNSENRVNLLPGLPRGMARLIALALLAVSAGGCIGPSLVDLQSPEDFQKVVLRSKRPVMVMFYKSGCPKCLALEPLLVRLAGEYDGLVVFAKYLHIRGTEFTSFQMEEAYHVTFVPTVLLFVNGRERRRWLLEYSGSEYRPTLDALFRPPPPASQPTTRPQGR
jgi:thiol-disulfide isomerase/thioredoxin